MHAYSQQQVHILTPVFFKIVADVQPRVIQIATFTQKESYHETPGTPVAVFKWVYGFKLIVNES